MDYEKAYPGIALRPRTMNWWARFTRVPAECIHLENEQSWMATLNPDTLYLCGKANARRQPTRPEVSLCRNCFLAVLRSEIENYPGGVVAFEPDPGTFSQYFFVAAPDFDAAGLDPDVAAAIGYRLSLGQESCKECSCLGPWLWFSREDVTTLDEVPRIRTVRGQRLCAQHGAQRLCSVLEAIGEVNLLYANVPYGEGGAYIWI